MSSEVLQLLYYELGANIAPYVEHTSCNFSWWVGPNVDILQNDKVFTRNQMRSHLNDAPFQSLVFFAEQPFDTLHNDTLLSSRTDVYLLE